MIRSSCVISGMLCLSAFLAVAQTAPVAYIYVSSNDSGSDNHVRGYAAGADGSLTQITGSPWDDNLSYLATNGSYLFGTTNIASDHGKNVFSYTVQSNGALKYIGANNIEDTGSANADNQAQNLLLDHTGSDLYVFTHDSGALNSGPYESFAVDKSTGLLNYLGSTGKVDVYAYPLTMLADNDWAFSPEGNESDGSDLICAYQKGSNGALLSTDTNNTVQCSDSGSPGLANGSGQYMDVAADPTNHLAAAMAYAGAGDVSIKIATIAINTANGAQSSTSSESNMPTSDVKLILNQIALEMAPSGKLLAVGGGNGLQIYNFDPSTQATPNTGLITTAPITAMYWDTSNHLYAISNADNALYVFTVAESGATEAPGSPYTIPHPVAMTGHSLSVSTPPSMQYEASFMGMTSAATGSGEVSMDTSGDITLKLSGAPASTSYAFEFCPTFYGSTQNPPSCIDLGTVSTSSGGSIDTSIKFSQPGQWAGDFELISGTTPEYETTYTPAYLSQLLPESTVNDGDLKESSATQLPLTSGSVAYSADSFYFTITGTSPDIYLYAIESESYLNSSNSYGLQGTANTTNSDGNLTFSAPPSGAGGDLLEIERGNYTTQTQQGFIGGFTVP